MKVSIEGKAFVSAGGVFVRQKISLEVTDTHALGEAIAILVRQLLGQDFGLIRGGVSKLSVATVIFDVSTHVEAIDSLKAQVSENSVQTLHRAGQLPRPGQAPSTVNPPAK